MLELRILTSKTWRKIQSTTPTVYRTFTQYVLSLSEWEQCLLLGVNFVLSPYEILNELDTPSNKSILTVSDGSVKTNQLTFGWVCGTDNTIFATHAGQGFGDPTSHRAESWGMLSGALFLHHLYQYTRGYTPSHSVYYRITFATDNNGLVTRIKQRLEYTRPYPNSTLAPDWEIIEQIHQTIKLLPHKMIQIEWVQGHQDPADPNLTIVARYNIKADNLASHAECTSQTIQHLRLLPAARCSLTIDDRVITGHYSSQIRTAFVLPTYFEYLTQRYGWTAALQKSVNWKVFQRAAANSWLP